MVSVPNTIRRAGVFHFRRLIPEALQTRMGRAELKCSLRTYEQDAARSLSRYLYLLSEDLFDAITCMPELTDDDISALVKDFYATILAKNDDVRLMSDAPDGWREARARYYSEVADRARQDLGSNAFGAVQEITTAMLARRYGGQQRFDAVSVRKASQAMLRAGIDVAETLRARAEGDFNYEPRDKILVRALANVAEAAPRAAQAAMPAAKPKGPMFSEEADRFRETQLRRKVWEQQTGLQARKTYALFAEHCDDRPIGSYARSDAVAFKGLLEDLPANYGKAAEFRGVRAAEIVRLCAERDIERLSSRTVQRHFAALATLWDSAIEQGHLSENIFSGWKFSAAKRARDQRQMWNREELSALFATPIWAGCQSEHRRSKPGQLILRDEKFWLPLIAVFSGMRQEEICQLRVADVRQVENEWVFDLNTRDGQQLKNGNAVRLVPVHAELARLGWLAYAKARKDAGDRMMFPALQPGGADDRLGHNYSKWFTRYRQDVKLFASGRDFHSFRHSATTFMRQAGIPNETIDELTGHATAGETARYSKGLTIANLSQAINTIDAGIDLRHLHLKF